MFGGWLGSDTNEEPSLTFNYIRDTAVLAEELGFDSIWIADHLLNPIRGAHSACFEAWTTLSAIAPITSRITLSHSTLCQGFRNPALLAKMASTLQEICGGRFILTLGAGWYQQEFESYGFKWQEHDVRIARAKEQIEIIKSLWTNPLTNYQGSFYSIKDGILEPKPNPIPEIWYGGESAASKSIAAELAEGWLFYPTPLEEIESKILSFKKLLSGREIKYISSSHVIIGKTDDEANSKLRDISRGNQDLENGIEKSGLVGSAETIREKMDFIRRAGVDVLLLRFSRTKEDLDLFSDSVFDEYR
jgi:FMNH2-dependent dimethyl sulfone monooxygenase